MVALVSITLCVFAVCLLPFMVSGLIAVQDARRSEYRLTSRVCVVAATLTVVYSSGIGAFQSSTASPTAEELVHWIALVSLWVLALMFCSGIFALLGYLTGAGWGRARHDSLVGSELSSPSGMERGTHEESGNPYQVPRV